MRVAALYDIHSNLPALEAVLRDLRGAGVDRIVVGGDVIPGPMPQETLDLLLGLPLPIDFIHGNGELAILAQIDAGETGEATYWGTVTGIRPPEPILDAYRWTAGQLRPEVVARMAEWPRTLGFVIDGLGRVLFCHATPRSETELFTRRTPEERLLPLFEKLGADVVICGHTHMPFDRMVGDTRVVNAGSVGSPFGETGAHWLLLGPDIEPQRTEYELEDSSWVIRSTDYPQADRFAKDLINPPPEDEVLSMYKDWEVR
jgi:predicted phosphodiesterase